MEAPPLCYSLFFPLSGICTVSLELFFFVKLLFSTGLRKNTHAPKQTNKKFKQGEKELKKKRSTIPFGPTKQPKHCCGCGVLASEIKKDKEKGVFHKGSMVHALYFYSYFFFLLFFFLPSLFCIRGKNLRLIALEVFYIHIFFFFFLL